METSIALKVIIAAVIIALYHDVIGLGCSAQTGCCPLNCTHVLNYEMCLSRYGIYKMYAHFLVHTHAHTYIFHARRYMLFVDDNTECILIWREP